MVKYEIEFSAEARQDFEQIYRSDRDRWSFSETDIYVADLEKRCLDLSHMPHRFSFDEHTRGMNMFRSFEHKAHKVFFTISETQRTVYISAVLPSRTRYASKL